MCWREGTQDEMCNRILSHAFVLVSGQVYVPNRYIFQLIETTPGNQTDKIVTEAAGVPLGANMHMWGYNVTRSSATR
jgi:hypothetical protein